MSQLVQRESIQSVDLVERREGEEITTFSPREIQILNSEFKNKVEVIFTGTGVILKATEHVGAIILPNHVVRIKPKISGANIMSMIIYALRLPEIGPGDLPALEHADFYYIIIRFLLSYLDDLLRIGLYKGYIVKSENLGYVKGKISFKQHIMYNQGRNDKIFCSFSEITVDTLENRIIKFTLSHLLRYVFVDNLTRLEILNFYKKLYMVTDLKSITRIIFGSITYTPLNDHYRTVLSLCELILTDASLDIENEGQRSSRSFLINMDTLFEEFVAGLLTKKFGESNVSIQKKEYLDTNNQFLEYIDIVLKSDNTSIILDTKYKFLGQTLPSVEDVRQVFCYSRISKTKKCALIYASNESIPTEQYDLMDDVTLFRLHLNMMTDLTGFNQNCTELYEQINNIIKA